MMDGLNLPNSCEGEATAPLDALLKNNSIWYKCDTAKG